VIFSRRRGSGGKHARGDAQQSGPRHAAGRRRAGEPEPEFEYQEVDEGIGGGSAGDGDLVEHGPGPYDIVDAPAGVARLDLGSLQIPAVDEVEVRVQASPEGVIQQVVLVHGASALQLGVFAAPRSEGIWEEVRGEIRASLFADGVAAEETEGDYGTELRARVRTPEGLNDLRFVGIDGPRWMVRAVYQGPAAVDPSVAGPLADCLAGLVVNRGGEAMPVKDPLPLRLPRELAENQQSAPAEPAQPGANGSAGGAAGGAAPPRRKHSPRPRRS